MTKIIDTRRKFIKNLACTGLGFSTIPSSLLSLKSWASAAASTAADCQDYKALVCFYMFGGNDGFNTLIPKGDTEYLEYKKSRSNLSIPQDQIIALDPILNSSGRALGLHPKLTGVKDLFKNEKLSFISNVGTLIKSETSKIDYQNGLVPQSLFAHNEQIQQWQTGVTNSRGKYGWAGQIADLMMDCNTNEKISLNISLGGNNIMQSGSTTSSFASSSGGPLALRGIGYHGQDGIVGARTTAINSIFNHDYSDYFYNNYSQIFREGNAGTLELKNAIQQFETEGGLNTTFSNGDLGFSLSADLEYVAKVMANRENLGFKRQIFFVQVPAFDTHANLINLHSDRMNVVDHGLSEFYTALEELGLEDNVITFSMSDFGRTLTSNGTGSDHAWSSNAFVMGGKVKGKNIFGTYPSLELGNNAEVGRGTIIPEIASDRYLSELALWFGVAKSDLPLIFPNIREFYDISSSEPPLGFIEL